MQCRTRIAINVEHFSLVSRNFEDECYEINCGQFAVLFFQETEDAQKSISHMRTVGCCVCG